MLANYAHQERAIKRFSNARYAALLMEPGMGKSRTIIRILENKDDIGTIWIFTLKTIIPTWLNDELPKHSTKPYVAIPWKHGAMTDMYRSQFMEAVKTRDKLYIILNYEACLTERFDKVWKYVRLNRGGGIAMILDESTAIKTHSARRTRRLLDLAPQVSFRAILTGTPITNSPLDMYSQSEFLSPGQRLIGASNYYGARNRYAVLRRMILGNRAFNEIVGYQNQDVLAGYMAKFSEIARLEDAIDMPDRSFKEIHVPLTSEQIKHYANFMSMAHTILDEERINAVNALSLITALNQVCCGQLKKPDGTYAELSTNKLEALEEQLEELEGRKVIIWYPYIGVGERLQKVLGNRAERLTADDPVTVRAEKIDRWRAPSGPQCLLLNPALGGHGITLNEAAAMIYWGRSHSLEHRLQSLARNFRIGQEKPVLVIDLVSPGSVDSEILKALENKEELAETIVNKARLRGVLGL